MQAWALGRISFTEVIILFLLRLATYLSTVFTSSGRQMEVEVGREIEELGFSSTRFFTVSMFFSIILVRRGPRGLEGETPAEAIHSLITQEKK